MTTTRRPGPRKYRGRTVARVVRVNRRTVEVACPLPGCERIHTHGISPDMATEWTHRVAHCSPATGPLGYWLAPLATSIESTSTAPTSTAAR